MRRVSLAVTINLLGGWHAQRLCDGRGFPSGAPPSDHHPMGINPRRATISVSRLNVSRDASKIRLRRISIQVGIALDTATFAAAGMLRRQGLQTHDKQERFTTQSAVFGYNAWRDTGDICGGSACCLDRPNVVDTIGKQRETRYERH
jgi:hypothetical protein